MQNSNDTDISCLQGSRDNMSIVIIAFEGAPKVSEAAKKKEAELDKTLETKVKGTVILKLSYSIFVL